MPAEDLTEQEFNAELLAILAGVRETLSYLELGVRRRVAVADRRPVSRTHHESRVTLKLMKGGSDDTA